MNKEAERRARLEAVMRGTPPAADAADAAGRVDGAAGAHRRAAAPRTSPVGLTFRPADRRGLTAVGVVLVNLIGGFAGAAYDLSRGTHILGTTTGIALLVAAVIAALAAHREDIGATVVVPPLAYGAVVAVASIVTAGSGGSFVHNVAAEAIVHVITSAPGLLATVVATVVIALVRFLGGRASANRRKAAARRP